MNQFDPLEEKVDVEKLLKQIYFAEEDVHAANLTQAKLMFKVARYRVQKMRRKLQLTHELELTHAKYSYAFRKKLHRDKAPTEGAIKERVAIQPKIHELQKRLNKAIVDEELAKQLFEVFKQRQIAIRNIIEARRNEIAKNLYEVEATAKHKKLRDTAKILRGKYHSEEEEE